MESFFRVLDFRWPRGLAGLDELIGKTLISIRERPNWFFSSFCCNVSRWKVYRGIVTTRTAVRIDELLAGIVVLVPRQS